MFKVALVHSEKVAFRAIDGFDICVIDSDRDFTDVMFNNQIAFQDLQNLVGKHLPKPNQLAKKPYIVYRYPFPTSKVWKVLKGIANITLVI